MKKIFLLSTILVGSLLIYKPADAQFHISVNINAQPAWRPSGCDYAEYYYLPEVEAYYSIPRRQFIYSDGDNWVFSASLPDRCRDYDLYSGYKVVMNDRDPWRHFNNDRIQYASYRYRHDQVVINNGRGYGRGGYPGRPDFGNRSWGRDHDRYDDRDNHRQDRGRNDHYGRDDDRHDRNDSDHRHNDDRGKWGRGRWQ